MSAGGSSSGTTVRRADIVPPPVRVDAPLDDMRVPVVGRRVALFNPDGVWQRELIAVTEPEIDVFGVRSVLLAHELEWWAWRVAVLTGQPHTERPRNCRVFPTWAVMVENARLLPPTPPAVS